MKRMLLLPAVVFALMLAVAPACAERMYARAAATVRSGRALSAGVVARLRQGDAVETLERAGRHYRVSVGGQEGWIYYNKLTADRPEDIAALLSRTPGTQGIELTDVAAGGALRGLSPTAEQYALNADVPQWAVQAVEQTQSLRVTPEELDDFAREGGLGEYGEEE